MKATTGPQLSGDARKSRDACKSTVYVVKQATFIRDPSNSSRTSQLENWQQLVGLATVKIPTTILASVGTPTAIEVPKTVWTPSTHDFL
jgi:hypothetical protein